MNKTQRLLNILLRKCVVFQNFQGSYRQLSVSCNKPNFNPKNEMPHKSRVHVPDEVKRADDDSHTWVGPPHSVSNLRLKVYPSYKKLLTKEEQELYDECRHVQDWNQSYWEGHNTRFQELKQAYVERISKEKKLEEGEALSAEEMATFYKHFLDRNHKKHMAYNWMWYAKNFNLVYLAARAKLSKVKQSFGYFQKV